VTLADLARFTTCWGQRQQHFTLLGNFEYPLGLLYLWTVIPGSDLRAGRRAMVNPGRWPLPVELIDGDRPCDLLKEFRLGVDARERMAGNWISEDQRRLAQPSQGVPAGWVEPTPASGPVPPNRTE
jgi:hypothetical protein